ncbi:hypothetical protein [Microcoleus sp. N9_A1]|uniref:hypothetical protein n=1 Tax=Microcoleus sp. N9_A1 TaxID=3055380 RepID=UPI002FD545E0
MALGFIYWLSDFYNIRNLFINSLSEIRLDRSHWLFILGIFAVVFLNLWHYAGSVYSLNFQGLDDYHAYFVYPHKMLQMGSLGPDPFSERRLSSLGGHPFLQTFVLSALGNENLHLIDPGVSFLISVGLLLGYFKDKNLRKEAAILLLFIFLCIYYPQLNTSSTVTGTAMFLSLFRSLDWEEMESSRWIPNACIVALVTAGVWSLKTSLIPACTILVIASYFFYILGAKGDRRTAASECLLAGILTLLLLLPWMISMYQSSGTLLYPLLGKGYHGSAYGTYLHKNFTLVQALKVSIGSVINVYGVSVGLLGFAILRWRNWTISGREAPLSFLISAAVVMPIIGLSTGGTDSYRYGFPVISAAIIVLMTGAFIQTEAGEKSKLSNTAPVLIAMVVAGIMIGNNSNSLKLRYSEFAGNIKSGINNVALVSDQQIAQHIKMQQSIAEGETLLTRLERPFLLDFKRNKILLADWPGGASPPPGMPLFKGSEPLADYLTSQSIRYVAYSYAKEAAYSKSFLSSSISTENTWLRNQAENAWDFQANLKELGNNRQRLYDDGDIFVLDLLSRKKLK